MFPPKPPPTRVNLDHIHASPVSVAEHPAALRAMLADRGTATFGELVAGCTATLEVVARFLGLLNLYREAAVAFDQPEPLGDADRAVDPGTGCRAAPIPAGTDRRDGVRVNGASSTAAIGTDGGRPGGVAEHWTRSTSGGEQVAMTDDRRADRRAAGTDVAPRRVAGIRVGAGTGRGTGAVRRRDMVPDHDLAGALEAVLLVVDAPVTETALAAAVGPRPAAGPGRCCAELAARYTAASSGIELRELGGGWRFYTRDRFAPVVERFVLDGAQGRLSRAALETLAVVAYRQPVTRARIAAVRGVNVDGVIRTLMSRGLIEDGGRDPDTGGLLYRTTELFLERLGLSRPGGAALARPAAARRRRDRRCLTSDRPAGRETAKQGNKNDDRRRRDRTASGCRRCWPRPASRPAARPRS